VAKQFSNEVATFSRWQPDTVRSKLAKLTGRMSKGGYAGETIRISRYYRIKAPHPMSDAFEPRLLDETDCGFADLRFAWERMWLTNVADKSLVSPDNVAIWKTLRRNAILYGRWIGLIVPAFFFVRFGIEAYARRTITFVFALYLVAAALYLCAFLS